ncbi:MAG: UDP-N-acetylmuramoyl-L-alanine--D-glutamate ligase [Puniceicoccales bacterium]|jgi:UDP-N-acetylmuramoylalanine--D-glutamate ligase|nr:UDP-N-acetylmuramoyl-L-alanine--D-glutamate ligase [Puniceicoccales bacterium]
MAMDCTQRKILQEKFLQQVGVLPVAVLGNGVTAKGIRSLLEKLDLRSTLYDQNPQKGENFDGEKIRQHNVIIGSPSFLSHHPWVRLVKKSQKHYWSELDFASLWCGVPIVAVTGTNGKTTVTSFLCEIFNHFGRRAFTAGNIGRSLSELVATETLNREDIVFCETSSFQGENLEIFVPERLIWTNFAPNHLDHHRGLEDYFRAKYRLVQRLWVGHECCDDRLFCGKSVAFWAKRFRLKMPEETHYLAPKSSPTGTSFDDFPQRENYAIVEDFCRCYGIPENVVLGEAEHFRRPRYRLEPMGMVGGNGYWNDSKCTNFAALKGALSNFSKNVIWIGGGRFKGEKLEDLVPILKGKVRQAILIGETGMELEKILLRQKISAVYVKTIENGIRHIKNTCFSGENIVFSPAFPSFDQFSNFEERGKFFEKCIFDLKFLHF